jgi:cellobiose epimerase
LPVNFVQTAHLLDEVKKFGMRWFLNGRSSLKKANRLDPEGKILRPFPVKILDQPDWLQVLSYRGRSLLLALLLAAPFAPWAAPAPAPAATPSKEMLLREAERCRAILRSSLIDFYLPASLDRMHGGYKESLRDGQFALTGEKFLTLQTRQLWFFSTLALEGYEPEAALEAARHGFNFIQAHMLDPRHGGYFSKVTDSGEPRDPRKHAYHNAFAIYGLSAYHRASRDPQALEAARNLFKVLDAQAYDRKHGGYVEFFHADWSPVTDPAEPGYIGAIGHKTYNTHLHLLEAFAELYRAWPDPLLRNRLTELIHINSNTVRHPRFNLNIDAWFPDWRMVPTPRNLRASYGHDVECVWLTLDAARSIQMPEALLQNWAETICQETLRYGYDYQHGGFYAGGDPGAPADDTRKTWWVQAEALVSMLEMFKLTGNPEYYQRFTETLDFVAKHQVAQEGSWWATRAADGSPTNDRQRSSPWQGAYHNGRAMIHCANLLEDLAQTRATP